MKNNDLLISFQQQLNELTCEGAKFKIALSGGLDSVVLLHLFSRIDAINVVAHHIHHGLSDNADDWALFCERIALQLKVECQVSRVVLDKKNRASLEEVARDKRYAALKQDLTEQSYLVTAHHQDDQLETVLLALKRGAGLTGLQGIVAQQTLTKGYLIRPLLNFSREQLEHYADTFELQWIEDESNNDQRFDRNFIRHSITPLLKQRWPSITKTVARSASHCQSQQQLIDHITDADFQICLVSPQVLKIDNLQQLTSTRRNNVLRYWFKNASLNYPSSKQLIAIWNELAMAQEDAEPQLLLQGKIVCRYRGDLYLFDKKTLLTGSGDTLWQGEHLLDICDGRIQLKIEPKDETIKDNYQVRICFRKDLATNMKCQPIGRENRRSIKKLLHEYHVPPWLRDNVVFVVIDGVVVEAVGLFKCTTTLPDLLQVSVI